MGAASIRVVPPLPRLRRPRGGPRYPANGDVGGDTSRAATQFAAPSAREGFEHLGGVAVGAHVVPGALDPPVRTHEKRRPDDSQALAPVQRLRPKGAIKRHHLMVRVAQEGDLEPVLGPELLVLGAAVG